MYIHIFIYICILYNGALETERGSQNHQESNSFWMVLDGLRCFWNAKLRQKCPKCRLESQHDETTSPSVVTPCSGLREATLKNDSGIGKSGFLLADILDMIPIDTKCPAKQNPISFSESSEAI